MRRSFLFPVVFLSFLLCLFPILPQTALASRDKMILPDPSWSDTGTDAVLVIDVSGSMKRSDPDYLCKKAAMNFVDALSESPGSRAALITFSDSIQTIIPLTLLDSVSDENAVISELRSLTYTTGDTDIGTAMETAASLLTEEENDRAKSIFLLTDGEIDLPAAEDEEAAEKESLTRALMAVEEAKENDIVIHTVALDLSGSIDENLMNYMADSTGGTSSQVHNASALEDVFRRLSDFAARQSESMAETEAETSSQETEEETETETETETEEMAVPIVYTIGSVDGPVRLDGLLPNLCTAKLRLSDLFATDGTISGFSDSIRYTAYSDDNAVLSCSVEDDMLIITGLKNGTSRVQVIAEIVNPGMDSYTALEDVFPVSEPARLSFSVEVHALIPSMLYLALIPASLGLIAILIWFIRKGNDTSVPLSGTLQWYVRGENEKIYGMPGQTMADLKDYGSKVRLSELVQDDLLSGAPLDKVSISAVEDGILISSRSSSCLIAVAGGEPVRRLTMTHSGRFKVFCETGRGRAAVIAFYTSEAEYKPEPSIEDDSGERTRLLV